MLSTNYKNSYINTHLTKKSICSEVHPRGMYMMRFFGSRHYLRPKKIVAFASNRSHNNDWIFHSPMKTVIVRRLCCSPIHAPILEETRQGISWHGSHVSSSFKILWGLPHSWQLIIFQALYRYIVIIKISLRHSPQRNLLCEALIKKILYTAIFVGEQFTT